MAESPELREAIGEIQQYLSDRLAPLMVADAMEQLLRYPAAVLAQEVHAWVAQQSGSGVAVSDLLYHAAKKVALMGEFKLVPVEALRTYVTELARELLPLCPEDDREALAGNLEALGKLQSLAAAGTADTLHVVHRQARDGAPPAEAAAPAAKPAAKGFGAEVARGLKRLSLLLDRLKPQSQAAPVAAEQRNELASQFVSAAAVQAKSEKELEEHLAPLRQYGIEPAMDKIFRALASTLPGWGTIAGAGGEAPPLVGAQLNAMRQIVSLVEDPAEAARRFRELVQSAIEQFNDGHLGRAVTMFELAERLAGEQKVQQSFVDPLRKAHDSLAAERLRKYVDRSDTRTSLRVVLNFFYALRPEGLLADLNGEPRRERRHELLGMLEVHGPAARVEARTLLQQSVDDKDAHPDPFFQMNLVYLLRVIARPDDVSVEDEVNLVMRTPTRESPPPLVKQVIAYLANVRHDKCERALISYLRLFESMLLQPETTTYTRPEVETLLDRTCAGLARYATPRAWRALVDHGLKSEVRLGSPTARLVEAGRQDLSGTPELVDRIIVGLKGELPKSVLGFTVKKNDDRIIWLVQALSGTATDQVRATLQDIVDRFPGEKFAETAGKALANLGASSKPAPAAASLTGDLELFGLPNLLQTLSQSQVTGSLALLNKQGRPEATILLDKGQFRGAVYGAIKGARAVYQLFERPFPGTFAFVNREIASLSPNSPPRDVVGVILEGVRRHDEFKRAAALVPDDGVFSITETPQTPLSDEDPALVKIVWGKVVAGMSAQHCEAQVTVDGYHVRRLLAHWLEEGSLTLKERQA